MKDLMRTIKSEKGSSMMMVVMVIMILTMFGSALLVISLSNVRLAEKYKDWSSEYVELDGDSQQELLNLERMLKEADDFAQWYISNEVYKEASPAISKVVVGYKTIDFQNFTEDLSNVGSDKLVFPLGGTSIDPAFNVQNHFYTEYGTQVLQVVDFTNDASYQAAISSFHEYVYKELYFLIARRIIDSQSVPADEKFTMVAYDGSINPSIDISRTFENADGRKIDFRGRVILPTYDPVEETRIKRFRANPIQTNAITAQNGILFNAGTVTISGDLYGQDGHIQVNGNTTVNVTGNIYTNQDLLFTGNGPTMNTSTIVNNNPKDMKETSIGDNNWRYYIDDSFNQADVSRLSETNMTGFWFINEDRTKGNVYARNIHVVEGASNANANIRGNVWTLDDVTVEGNNSTVDIDKNFLGISTRQLATDHNSSSTVINNAYDESGVIRLNEFFIPGLSYIQFNGTAANPTTPVLFRTLESASANNPEIFAAYNTGVTSNSQTYVLNVGGVDYLFYLEDAYATNQTDAQIQAYINTHFTSNVASGILIDDPATTDSYSLGAVVNDGSIPKKYSNSTLNAAFRSVDEAVFYNGIFDAKTKEMFVDGTNASSFANLVNNSNASSLKSQFNANRPENAGNTIKTLGLNHMYYNDQDTTMNLTGVMNGIVYVDGNITINGSGTFNGTIIANGRVTVTGSPTINYDETIISRLMANDTNIQQFFAPNLHGGYNTAEIRVSTSGIFDNKKRFKVIKWADNAQ